MEDGRSYEGRPLVSAAVLAQTRADAVAIVLDRVAELPVDEVIVVENGPPGPVGEVARGRDKVRLLNTGENLGIAALNVAAHEATGDLLVILDDDSYPLPGAVETLAELFARSPRLGVAGGLVHDVDEQGEVIRSDGTGTFDWFLRAGRSGDPPPDGFPSFFFPQGACMVRREAFLEAGGFFEPYFYAGSEIDLSTRLQACGWDVRYHPRAVFHHMKERNEFNAVPVARGLQYRIRNNIWYHWLRYPPAMAAPRIAGYLAFDLIQAAYLKVPQAWLRAVWEAFRRRDEVRPYRRPLPREVLRRAVRNRGRMHVRLLWEQLVRRSSPARRRQSPAR